jgi:hypothetical protein
MSGAFARLYASQTLSDYDVVLIEEGQREPGPEEATANGARVVPGHGAVLMCKSEYFNIKMLEPLGQDRAKAPGKPRLFVQVRRLPRDAVRLQSWLDRLQSWLPVSIPQLDAALWDAFEQQLLYHVYHDKLPKGLALGQVLQLALLADRFQV